ncbi:MAG: hypothetical protein NTU91_09875 [Chloroflexi bacterium]|nr:hypothetical protein [Chloroflexota bacterium]
MEWSSIRPETPYYFFIPKNLDFLAEYQAGWPITGVMPTYVNGIVTARDGFVIDFEDEVIEDRVRVFLDEKRSDAKVGEELGLSENYAWRVRDARRELRGVRNWPRLLTDILYRPFDIRRIIYHDSVVWRTRSGVMRHMMAGRNLALCTNRYVNGEFRHVGVTRDIINDCTLSLATKERTYLFPLFLYPDENTTDLLGGQQLSPNIGADFARVLSAAIAVPRNREVLQAITPEDVLNYVYAVFHSPGYRSRYSEFLKIDFPRLPLPGSADLFRDLARLGGELVGLHLLESPMLAKFITTYVGPKNPEVSRVAWSDDTVWLDAASTKKGQRATPGTVGFGGIPEAVWNFHIGGYQVCEKWLKDRKGRKLLKADIDHYQRVVVALSETIRLMKEIDEVIDKHGGWPAAFATGVTPPTAEASAVREAEVIPLFPDTPSKEYVREAPPLRKVAEPTVERPDPDELDREDLMCRIRQLFSVGEERERETAIDVLARELGYERTGPRIHEELDNALRTAVRRGIVIASGGVLKLDVRRIEDYDRAILKELFLASLQGRVWTEREDAIRGLARWVGFRRTGAAIDEEVRSVINGLIREGPLESAGGLIRRTGGD